jgi:hypothetical protein
MDILIVIVLPICPLALDTYMLTGAALTLLCHTLVQLKLRISIVAKIKAKSFLFLFFFIIFD